MTDTDGLYDRCCGERPTVTERGDVMRVSCESCGAATLWLHRLDVMIAWNKMQRKVRSSIRDTVRIDIMDLDETHKHKQG